ncbi:MAG: fumarylacetoacetate hydrolase family protein [Micrococcaceae bacterium]
MRIVRFNHEDTPKYGVIHGSDDDPKIAVIKGDPLYQQPEPTGEVIKLKDVRLLSPVIPRSKIVGAGKNFKANTEEEADNSGAPIIFFKPNTAVIGNGDPVRLPKYSDLVSYEGEVAVVISRMCKDVPEDKVKDVIYGYTVANDLTARDLLESEPQWTRAKGFDGSCPLGPWIETDLDVNDLQIRTWVDGEEVQNGSTDLMIHDIPKLVSFISNVCTLLPGDVILTGSPVGFGGLKPGQEVEVEVEGIGVLRNPIVA